MGRLRVIQWTTGKIGKHALRAILDDPRLELAGVYAWSPDKAGIDAGRLCDRPDTGILSTSDIEALIATGADTVIYTPFMADLDQVVRLLEAGMDVVSTNLFLNVGGVQGETERRLATACERGRSSLYVTGINPGWINALTAGMTAICRDVRSVLIAETANCATYESPETWLAMGMSLPEATPAVVATARAWLQSFYDAAQRVAAALDFRLDDMAFHSDFATASERVDLGWFVMEKGTIAAVRAGWKGKIAGRTVVEVRITWYLTTLLAEGWEFSDDHYHLVIDGEPGIDSRIRFVAPPHWGNSEWDTITAMPAVNAAIDVAHAPPGILTLKDAGLTCAPAGLWPS